LLRSNGFPLLSGANAIEHDPHKMRSAACGKLHQTRPAMRIDAGTMQQPAMLTGQTTGVEPGL